MSDIRTVGILGAGQMGLGIAQVATRAGFDRNPRAILHPPRASARSSTGLFDAPEASPRGPDHARAGRWDRSRCWAEGTDISSGANEQGAGRTWRNDSIC